MTKTSTKPTNNAKLLPPDSPPAVEDTNAPQPPQQPKRGIPKPVRMLGAIALIAGIGYGVYRGFFYQPEPEGLFLSGRIEGYETDVAAKIGGRIAKVAVREGDLVKPGQFLLQIDDDELHAQLQGAEARVRAAQERLQRSRQQIPILQAQLEEATLTIEQVQQESQGRVMEAKNTLAAARAELAQAEADLTLALAEQRRTQELFAQGVVSGQQLDEDNAQAKAAQARVVAERQQVQAAAGTLAQAQSTRRNVPIRAAAAAGIKRQITQAQTDISIAEQELRDAQAAKAEVLAQLDYLALKSPTDGTIITRSVEPGEVVAAGEPLLTLVDLDELYLRGFIPEGQIGKVKLGQRAQVYLDSFPHQPLQATVSRIDPKASFTPENIYFREDRVTQVFGVELTLKNPQGLAKPGMPADGRILAPATPQTDRSHTMLPFELGFLGT